MKVGNLMNTVLLGQAITKNAISMGQRLPDDI